MGKPTQVKKVQIPGGINIILWDSDRGPYMTLEKSYKDKATGEWKKTNTFFMEQMANIRKSLNTEFQVLDEIKLEDDESSDDAF